MKREGEWVAGYMEPPAAAAEAKATFKTNELNIMRN